jgi:hypothetical protein
MANPLAFQPEMLGEEVKKDQPLGYTFNPQTLDVVDEMKSRFDGLLYSIRGLGPIALGEWSCLVGEKSKAKWLEQHLAAECYWYLYPRSTTKSPDPAT